MSRGFARGSHFWTILWLHNTASLEASWWDRLLRDCGIGTRTCEPLSAYILHFSNYVVLAKFLGIQRGSLKKLESIALEDRQLFPWKCDFKFIRSKFQETPACSATYITHFRGMVYMKQHIQFHIQNFIFLSFLFLY